MRTIILILAIAFLGGCTSDENLQQFVLATSIQFSVSDAEGNDLLDPENPDSYKHSDIKLYYKKEGKYEEVYEGHLDSPRKINIYKHIKEYRIGVSLNDSEKEMQPETLIKWNENETDTVKCEVYRAEGIVRVVKVWLNGSLIWDAESETEPYFAMTK